MVKVFCTNVYTKECAQDVICALKMYYPDSRITIDLGDIDKVLRVETQRAEIADIMSILHFIGYSCNELK